MRLNFYLTTLLMWMMKDTPIMVLSLTKDSSNGNIGIKMTVSLAKNTGYERIKSVNALHQDPI